MFCVHVFVFNMCTPQNSEEFVRFLELVFQTIVNCCVGAGNQTHVLWKSNEYS